MPTADPHARTPPKSSRRRAVTVQGTSQDEQGLQPLFQAMLNPSSVALIGATDRAGSVGRALVENLQKGSFAGPVYLINPKRSRVLGTRVFPSVSATPETADLAIVATPAATVPQVIDECGEAGVKGAVVISTGFRETGSAGLALEQEALAAASGRLRIIGPNSLGLMLPHLGLNASLAGGMARRGSVGFVSQSGALCSAILDWSFGVNVGFSAVFSIGSMADAGWADALYYLVDDPHTRSIVMYMETMGDARSFLSAAREVALHKPIIVLKVGRTQEAVRTAQSHTGAMAGSDAVVHAAFRRAGVLRVDTIAELFEAAEALEKQRRPTGSRLAVISNAGGPGALAIDMLIRHGGTPAAFSSEAVRALDELLPTRWNRGNPADILDDATPDRFVRAVEIAMKDTENDCVLVILAASACADPAETAAALAPFSVRGGKPLLASWMGGASVEEGRKILRTAGVPVFDYPDIAARVFCQMWRHSRSVRALYETPAAVLDVRSVAAHASADSLIANARASGRTILNEAESKSILAEFGIPVTETRVANTVQDATRIAAAFGYPVAVKLLSSKITHKSAMGGVKLDVRGAPSVAKAFREIQAAAEKHAPEEPFQGVTVQPMVNRSGVELIFGSAVDQGLGPVLLFGAGGGMFGLSNDWAIGLPPLNATLARRLMERTLTYRALIEWQDRLGICVDELTELLVRFSYLVIERRLIREIDVNPLIVSAEGAIALDARMILHDPSIDEKRLPMPAIRPYPSEYVFEYKMPGGTAVVIRPIRPEDEPLMVAFHKTLSEESVHSRYFAPLALAQRVAHERLTRICSIDYAREIVLVAEHRRVGETEILGVGRLIKEHGAEEGEFAVLVGDPWQRSGLGTRLLELIVDIGRAEGLRRIFGYMLRGNTVMQRVARSVGFKLRDDGEECFAEIVL